MRKTQTVLVGAMAGLAGILLAACSNGSNGQPININTGQTQTGISVSGTGEVTGAPDTVTLDIGVSVLGATVAEASGLAATKADAVISSFKDNGVDDEDITTTNYSIYPEYEWRNNDQKLLGYRVNNTVRVKIHDIAGTGDVVDEAVSAGGDEVTVNGIQFSIEDDAEMIQAARDAAWRDAATKAEQLAALSGQTLGAAVTISETVSANQPPIPYDRAVFDAGGAESTTPIQPGTSTVIIMLQVTFSLEA